MSSRKIDDLIPPLQIIFYKFKADMDEAGHKFLVTCTLRHEVEQIALWLQGRDTLEVVNEARRNAQLPDITEKENTRRVTWTKYSKHFGVKADSSLGKLCPDWVGKSMAFDIAMETAEGVPHWQIKVDVDEDGIPDYVEAAKIGESVGLISGRSFPNPDYPHLEYKVV